MEKTIEVNIENVFGFNSDSAVFNLTVFQLWLLL